MVMIVHDPKVLARLAPAMSIMNTEIQNVDIVALKQMVEKLSLRHYYPIIATVKLYLDETLPCKPGQAFAASDPQKLQRKLYAACYEEMKRAKGKGCPMIDVCGEHGNQGICLLAKQHIRNIRDPFKSFCKRMQKNNVNILWKKN